MLFIQLRERISNKTIFNFSNLEMGYYIRCDNDLGLSLGFLCAIFCGWHCQFQPGFDTPTGSESWPILNLRIWIRERDPDQIPEKSSYSMIIYNMWGHSGGPIFFSPIMSKFDGSNKSLRKNRPNIGLTQKNEPDDSQPAPDHPDDSEPDCPPLLYNLNISVTSRKLLFSHEAYCRQ